jgi:predicted alpha/beta hydrolase
VVQKTEREFLRYDYRTNLADLKTMAREMHSLGWARQDFSAQIDSMIDLRFIAKATGMSVEALTRW